MLDVFFVLGGNAGGGVYGRVLGGTESLGALDALFQLANARQVLVQLGLVGAVQLALNRVRVVHDKIEDRSFFLLALCQS